MKKQNWVKLSLSLCLTGTMCSYLIGCPASIQPPKPSASPSGSTIPSVTSKGSCTECPEGYGKITGVVYTEGIKAGTGIQSLSILEDKDKDKDKTDKEDKGPVAVGAKVFAKGLEAKETKTKADGSFEIMLKGGSDYVVEATVIDDKGGSRKFTTPPFNIPAAKDPQIMDIGSFVTHKIGSIQGVVALGDGKDAEGVDIFVPGTDSVGKAAKKGNFTLSSVSSGKRNIVLQKSGYETAYKQVEVISGQPTMIEKIILTQSQPKAGIKGRVLKSDGKPIPGATVTAFLDPEQKKALANERPDALDSYMTSTDINGNYELTNLPTLKSGPVKYSIQFYRAFYDFTQPSDIELLATDIPPKQLPDVKMNSSVAYFGEIKGKVIDELGNPIESAIVQVDPSVTKQEYTDADGNFNLTNVWAGEYKLNISIGGYCTVVMPVALKNEQNFVLELAKPVILEANNPISKKDVTSRGECIYIIYPEDECYSDNADIGRDPGTTPPAEIKDGKLIPAGSVSGNGNADKRKCRCVVNLSGMVDSAGNPVEFTEKDIKIIEDGVVKTFKFTEAEKAGRALPVDIGLIIDTTGSMGEEIAGVKKSALDFVNALYEKNIDAKVGSVAYADAVTGNPAGIIPGTDPASMTITGFEYLTPFSDDDGLERVKGADGLDAEGKPYKGITSRINAVTDFLSNLAPCYSGNCGGDWPEGALDSLMWAFNIGTGKSKSGLSNPDFGWRDRAQKIFIMMTDAPTWEKGGSEISPSSTWTVPLAANELKGKATVHAVSPDYLGGVPYPNSGDVKGLAVGTGGTWTLLPVDGNVDLTKLPVIKVLGKSVKLEYVSLNMAKDAAKITEHKVRVIVDKGGLQGETTFSVKY